MEERLTRGGTEPVITGALDLDLYKLTQMQMVYHRAPEDLSVSYVFTNRTRERDVLDFCTLDEISDQVSFVFREMRFTSEDLDNLKSIGYFTDDFLDFLRNSFPLEAGRDISWVCGSDAAGRLILSFEGPWKYSILFETLLLSLLSEMYSRKIIERLEQTYKGKDIKRGS